MKNIPRIVMSLLIVCLLSQESLAHPPGILGRLDCTRNGDLSSTVSMICLSSVTTGIHGEGSEPLNPVIIIRYKNQELNKVSVLSPHLISDDEMIFYEADYHVKANGIPFLTRISITKNEDNSLLKARFMTSEVIFEPGPFVQFHDVQAFIEYIGSNNL